jgi:hypothetical protein
MRIKVTRLIYFSLEGNSQGYHDMGRLTGMLGLMLLASGCRTYDRYSRVTSDDGLVPSEVFARFGAEQAQAVAIGRALGTGYTGADSAALMRQTQQAAEYARRLPDVTDVQIDPAAFLLTVTFRSGWQKAIVPIDDGVAADQTPGLPARR